MATIHEEIPALDVLLDSILDRLPDEVVASLASMRPKTVRRKKGETLADQLVRLTQLRARARTDKAGPLPDEPDFNEVTRRTIEDARAGKNVTRYESAEEMFADLGI
ncbi:hypothetical protein [Paludisphaera mucosa]|uniref:Uncharacterized protein n=1 Tax=Paludisphaera mucosa TaxID=3030827 RepID=A0ABT6FL11_9BACT|nr:hypothetical protein [Paludisphaera mucosa]MDG3008254.1 hypothetical protein [Paludisphaera mucosa]